MKLLAFFFFTSLPESNNGNYFKLSRRSLNDVDTHFYVNYSSIVNKKEKYADADLNMHAHNIKGDNAHDNKRNHNFAFFVFNYFKNFISWEKKMKLE